METIRKIRCAYQRNGKSIRQIARDMQLSRNTVKRVLRGEATEFTYSRSKQPLPKLGPYEETLLASLAADSKKPRRDQRTAMRLFEELQHSGFEGGYDSVRRYVQKWRRRRGSPGDVPGLQGAQGPQSVPGDQVAVFIPQCFDPGEAYQFDWSHETVELGGVATKVKVAHFRLCYSRMPFCVAYHRESLEMLLDAHVRAFSFFGGSVRRGIYDNLKTVVTKILQGKDRTFHRRFQQLASHYLLEPVACTPAAGWEKGQVENQVGFIRQRMFVPRLKFADLDELNRWLSDRCRTLAAGHRHPEFKDRTVAEVFAEEEPRLAHVGVPFEGYKEIPVRVTTTSLVAYDTNRYSVDAGSAGRTVMLRAYAHRIVAVDAGVVVGEHSRLFSRHQVRYDPWHYVAVLERKPGALRNGAPFRDWELPPPIAAMRLALEKSANRADRPELGRADLRQSDADRQFVGILGAIATYGLETVAAACAEALEMGTASRDVVLNILGRRNDDPDAPDLPSSTLPERLPILTAPPLADCARYDTLLSGGNAGGPGGVYAAR